jgi:hypothetical protein
MTLFVVSKEPGSNRPTLTVYVDGKKVAASELTLAATLSLLADLSAALKE